MNLLSSVYGLKNIQAHRSIDLLITLLEKGIEKADYGLERTKIKGLLAKTDRKLFSGEDLARIKDNPEDKGIARRILRERKGC